MSIECIHTILDSSATEASLHAAVQTLHARWSAVSRVRGDVLEAGFDQPNLLKDGIAVSPGIAALCWLDTPRSVIFLRGVKDAIDHLLNTIDDRPLEVVYAGCGPFAALVTPLLPLYQPDDLTITLLDANWPSVEGVRQIFEHENLTPFLNAVIECDATEYVHPTAIHLLISETMQAALQQEPQVAITKQLAPQLHPGGVLVPEQITVQAALTDSSVEAVEVLFRRNEYGFCLEDKPSFAECRLWLGELICLDKKQTGDLPVESVINQMPPDKCETDLFLLITSIIVFGRWHFSDYDCQLTFPHRVFELGRVEPGMRVQFSYESGPNPRFSHFEPVC